MLEKLDLALDTTKHALEKNKLISMICKKLLGVADGVTDSSETAVKALIVTTIDSKDCKANDVSAAEHRDIDGQGAVTPATPADFSVSGGQGAVTPARPAAFSVSGGQDAVTHQQDLQAAAFSVSNVSKQIQYCDNY